MFLPLEPSSENLLRNELLHKQFSKALLDLKESIFHWTPCTDAVIWLRAFTMFICLNWNAATWHVVYNMRQNSSKRKIVIIISCCEILNICDFSLYLYFCYIFLQKAFHTIQLKIVWIKTISRSRVALYYNF